MLQKRILRWVTFAPVYLVAKVGGTYPGEHFPPNRSAQKPVAEEGRIRLGVAEVKVTRWTTSYIKTTTPFVTSHSRIASG